MNTQLKFTRNGLLRALSNVMVWLTFAWGIGWMLTLFLFAQLANGYVVTGVLASSLGIILVGYLAFVVATVIAFNLDAWLGDTQTA